MKYLGIAFLVLVMIACGGKKAADTSAVEAEIQAKVEADFTSADAFLATLDQAGTVALNDDIAVTVDSLRKLSAADVTVSFDVNVDRVVVDGAQATAFARLFWTRVAGTDTVDVTIPGSIVYTKGEAGWARN
jgi:hypothetical protein